LIRKVNKRERIKINLKLHRLVH